MKPTFKRNQRRTRFKTVHLQYSTDARICEAHPARTFQRQSEHRRPEAQGEILQLQLQAGRVSVCREGRRVYRADSGKSEEISGADPAARASSAVFQCHSVLPGIMDG